MDQKMLNPQGCKAARPNTGSPKKLPGAQPVLPKLLQGVCRTANVFSCAPVGAGAGLGAAPGAAVGLGVRRVGEGAVEGAVPPGGGAAPVHAARHAAAVPAPRQRLRIHILRIQMTQSSVEVQGRTCDAAAQLHDPDMLTQVDGAAEV